MTGTVITEAHKEKIAQLRGERGWSYGRIGQVTGLKSDRVAWHCLANGIDSPRTKRVPPPYNGPMQYRAGNNIVRRFTPEEDAQMLQLRLQNKGYHAIGKIMGRAHNSIKMRLATLARRDERLAGEHDILN